MQWSSSQKPVEGSPQSLPGRGAAQLPGKCCQSAQAGGCSGIMYRGSSSNPLATPPVPESRHLPPSCQEHFHTEIQVMFPSSLSASNLCCPSEKTTFTMGEI